MNDALTRKVWVLPGFTAILVTVLLLWLAGSVADLLLLLFLAVLVFNSGRNPDPPINFGESVFALPSLIGFGVLMVVLIQ